LRLHVVEQLIDRRQGRVQVRQAVLELGGGHEPVEIAGDFLEVRTDVLERNRIELVEEYIRLRGDIVEVARARCARKRGMSPSVRSCAAGAPGERTSAID